MLERETQIECQPGQPALIDAAIEGDAQAFAALYDEYVDRVYRYVYHWVGNRVDVEDLTQQTFLRAWEALPRYRRTGAFAAWLMTIAHNQIVSFFRKGHRETTVPDFELVVSETASDPESEALATYDRQAVRRAILRLKPEQQQVIVMRFIEDFPYRDIAASLGKSQATVRVIQFRALAELRRMLAHQMHGAVRR